jgi:hypothetical protein
VQQCLREEENKKKEEENKNIKQWKKNWQGKSTIGDDVGTSCNKCHNIKLELKRKKTYNNIVMAMATKKKHKKLEKQCF